MKSISIQGLQQALISYKLNSDKQMDNYLKELEVTAFKEISNPLTSDEITKENPIGTIITYSGTSAPEHFLPCDGSIYNINDYPYLAEHFEKSFGKSNIYGGDGITTFAVPILNKKENDAIGSITSLENNEVKIIYSSEYSSDHSPLRAFNKVLTSDWWMSAGGVPQYIGIEFKSSKCISSYKIYMRSYDGNDIPNTPKIWRFECYDTATSAWIVLDRQEHVINTSGRVFEIKLNNIHKYNKYRVFIEATQGGSYSCIAELYMYEQDYESYYIKYEPTHYAINQYGGFCSEVLFEGNANTIGDYDLVDSIRNYDYLIIETSHIEGRYTNENFVSNYDSSNILLSNLISPTHANNLIEMNFKNDKTFTIWYMSNVLSINKITGYRGSIPSLLGGGEL